MIYSIYIVDDEQTITDSVTMALEDDYRIKAFSDAETAIAQLEKDPPDLILLDILMPGMDGYEVCRRLSASPSTSTAASTRASKVFWQSGKRTITST